MEEILTEDYYFKLEDAVASLSLEQKLIFENNLKESEKFNRYEILFVLSILSKEEAFREIQESLKYEYMNDIYVMPQPKVRVQK